MVLSKTDRLAKLKRHRRTAHGNPDNGGLAANFVQTAATARSTTAGDGNRNGRRAAVALRGDSKALDASSVARVGVANSRLAVINGHAVQEVLGKVVMLERDNRPVGQAVHFLGNGLDPANNDGKGASLGSQSALRHVDPSKVSLVEHVGIGLQVEEVRQVDCASVVKQVGKGAGAVRDELPLLQHTLLTITVVVDGGGITGDDPDAFAAVSLSRGGERPVLALSVAQNRAGVVADNQADSVLGPSTDNVTVMKTGDGGRNEALGRPALGLINAGLLEPGLIEVDFAGGIVECSVVELVVREGVRNVGKCVSVGRVHKPQGKVIKVGTRLGPVVSSEFRGPNIRTSAKRLLKLELSVGRRDVVDCLLRDTDTSGLLLVGRGNDVTVAVVTHLQPKVGSAGQTRVEAALPLNMGLKIASTATEFLCLGEEEAGAEVDVVNLDVEMGLALARECAASHPVEVRVLQVAGGQGPLRCKGQEEDHLLTAIHLVNDTSNSALGEPVSRLKVSKSCGGVGCRDDSRVVVKVISRNQYITRSRLARFRNREWC